MRRREDRENGGMRRSTLVLTQSANRLPDLMVLHKKVFFSMGTFGKFLVHFSRKNDLIINTKYEAFICAAPKTTLQEMVMCFFWM